jgi:hypothetical protein
MEIGMADTAEQDVDLDVVCGWIAAYDGGAGEWGVSAGEWGVSAGGGISFGVVHVNRLQ